MTDLRTMYCNRCQRDAEYRRTGRKGCKILSAALVLKPGEKWFPKEIDGDTCTEFLADDVEPSVIIYRCDKTHDLFESHGR